MKRKSYNLDVIVPEFEDLDPSTIHITCIGTKSAKNAIACKRPTPSYPPMHDVKKAVNIPITSSRPFNPKYLVQKGTTIPEPRSSVVMFSDVEMRGSSWRRERPNVRSATGRRRIKGRARSTRVSFNSRGVEGFDGDAGGMVAGGFWGSRRMAG